MGESTLIFTLVLFNIFFIVFLSAIIIFIRQYKVKKKKHLEDLKTKELIYQQELLSTKTEIQQETMKHIGREIHDNVGQKLTLSSMYLQQLVFENKVPQVNENINSINTIINESLEELRQLSKSLTDDSIKTKSLEQLIKEECKKVEQLKAFKIIFKSNLKGSLHSYKIKGILLRIVQEFIQNSIKHSQCKTIEISLQKTSNNLKVIMSDDGKGFNILETQNQGIGLRNIKNRVDILHGKSNIVSNTSGTTLTIKIPLDDV